MAATREVDDERQVPRCDVCGAPAESAGRDITYGAPVSVSMDCITYESWGKPRYGCAEHPAEPGRLVF